MVLVSVFIGSCLIKLRVEVYSPGADIHLVFKESFYLLCKPTVSYHAS